MSDEILHRLREEMEVELTENILPWWLKHAPDETHGGFIGHFDFHGNPDHRANKGAILHGRILWTFAAAYNVLGREFYLNAADKAFRFYRDHFTDKEFGGVYWELDYTGKPAGTKKQTYAIAFGIYACAEYYQATGDKDVLAYAISLYRDIEEHCFDHAQNGYFEAFSRDWGPISDLRLSARDQNENKTMNTHLHILEAYTALYRVWPDEGLAGQLRNLVDLFLERFCGANGHLNLFFDDDWNLKSDLVSFGHDIEASWLINEAAEELDDEALEKRADKMSVKMAEANFEGLDTDGGLYYEYFPAEGRWDTDKHWWPQAEAIVGHLNAYALTGDDKYLFTATGTWEFIRQFLIDREHGEWHWSVDKHGQPNREEEKAGFWKCPYHNSRACLEVMKRVG